MRGLTLILVGIMTFLACHSDNARSPKPRAYPKVDYPERLYDTLQKDLCPFTFVKPTYSSFIRDSLYFDSSPAHPCWFDLYLKPFNGKIHFSYYDVSDKEELDGLMRDAFKLSGKHNIRANYIDERPFRIGKNVGGVFFEIEGPVASPLQFFITDSTNHFMRGALYFQSKANQDSLRPIYEFVREDIAKMIETFSWK